MPIPPAAMVGVSVRLDHALKNYRVRETNPLLRPLDRSPRSLVTVGALMDAGAFSAWNLTVGRRNERVAAAGLWAMAAFRTYLVFHNLRTERRAARREAVPVE